MRDVVGLASAARGERGARGVVDRGVRDTELLGQRRNDRSKAIGRVGRHRQMTAELRDNHVRIVSAPVEQPVHAALNPKRRRSEDSDRHCCTQSRRDRAVDADKVDTTDTTNA